MLLFKMRSQWTSLSSKSNDFYHTGLGESEKSLSCARLFVTPDCSPPGSCQWNSAGNNGVGRHCLLQGIFPTQGSNLGLLHSGKILYQLSHEVSPGVGETSPSVPPSSHLDGSQGHGEHLSFHQSIPTPAAVSHAALMMERGPVQWWGPPSSFLSQKLGQRTGISFRIYHSEHRYLPCPATLTPQCPIIFLQHKRHRPLTKKQWLPLSPRAKPTAKHAHKVLCTVTSVDRLGFIHPAPCPSS